MKTSSNLDFVVDTTDKIDSGELDAHLQILKDTIDKRLAEIRGNLNASDFMIGDKVRINERCGTKYLVGDYGFVVGIRRSKIAITLENPKGRFVRKSADGTTASAEVIVPVAIVDKVL